MKVFSTRKRQPFLPNFRSDGQIVGICPKPVTPTNPRIKFMEFEGRKTLGPSRAGVRTSVFRISCVTCSRPSTTSLHNGSGGRKPTTSGEIRPVCDLHRLYRPKTMNPSQSDWRMWCVFARSNLTNPTRWNRGLYLYLGTSSRTFSKLLKQFRRISKDLWNRNSTEDLCNRNTIPQKYYSSEDLWNRNTEELDD